MATLTQERLKSLMTYNPETGEFVRSCFRSANAKVGDVAGHLDSHGYLCIYIDGYLYRSHRLAWLYVYGTFPKEDLDHIDTVRTNNRIANLRKADRTFNMQNKRRPSANNKSGFLGVYFHKPLQKFAAQIRINGRNTHLGLFGTAEDAHQAYLYAKRNHHEGNTL